jgi:hypothetical protein
MFSSIMLFSPKFSIYNFYNSKDYDTDEELISLFDIHEDYAKKFKIGQKYTFKIDDLSVNDEEGISTYDDYQNHIKDKNEITIIINWIKVVDFDEDGEESDIGFSFITN